MTDIIERLKRHTDGYTRCECDEHEPFTIMIDATDTIAVLTAERDALLAALAEAKADHAMVTELYNASVSDYTKAREQLAESVEALEPFAKAGYPYPVGVWLDEDEAEFNNLSVGDLRRARDIVERAKA